MLEDRYKLHASLSGDLHWWTCTGCGKPSGVYRSLRAARDSAERHVGTCTIHPA